MKRHSDNPEDFDALREKIIGLGERSVRKSYYPKLQEQLRELEQTKEQLKQLSREQQLILESAGEGIFGLDLNGNYTFMNKAAAEMLGYKPGELIGRHSHSCIHYMKPDGTPYAEEECRTYAAFRDGVTRHVDDECFCRKDGSQFPVEYTSTPIREDGKLTGAVVTFRDTTERRRAEEALRRSEENYRTIFNSANDAIAIQDIETATILEVNQKALEMFGYTREEAIGLDIAVVSAGTPGFTKEDAKTWIRRAIESGPQFLEWHSKKKNGELFWIEVNIKPVVLQGELRLLSIFRDITDRKRAQEALRTSEENYRSIFDSANDGIFVHDIDTGEVISINKKTQEMYGLSLDELRDFGNQAIFVDVPGYRAQDAMRWIRNAAEGQPQMFEWLSKRKNGELFWLEVNLKRANIGGKPRLLAIVRDITERKRTQEALRESEWRLAFATSLANEAIWDWDLVADKIARNAVYEKMFGRPPEAGNTAEWWRNRIHPEDRERVVSAFTDVMEGKQDDLNVEYHFLLANGTWGVVHDRAKVIRNTEGKPVRIVGTMQNITERKQVENRIRQSEANLRTVMDSVYDAVFIHKLDGTIIDVNRKMLELYRVDREQALHSRIIEDFSAPDNAFEKVPDIWNRAVSGEDQLFEWKARRPNDGSVFDVEVFLTRISYGLTDVILANVRDITERKKSGEMKARLSAIVETAEDAILSENLDGIIQTWNNGAQKIYGYSSEEITGKSLKMLIPPDKKSEFNELLQKISRGEHLDHYETERIRKDGSRFHVSLSVSPIKDPEGKITGASIIAHDITERVRTEEALKLTQFSVDNASVSSFLINKNGRLLYVNKHACRILGYDCTDLLEMSYPDLDPAYPASGWPDHWDHLKKAGSLQFETRHRKKDGTWVTMEMSANYVSFAGREYNWAFGQDINERKKTEQQLQESEQRFRQLAENTDQVFWFMLVFPERTLYISPAFERIWGRSVRELYENARLWMEAIHPEDRPDIERHFEDWINGKSENYDVEYRILTPDGRIRWIRDRGTLVRDSEGRASRVSGIADDVTERKRADEDIRRTQEQLEEAQHIAGIGSWERDMLTNEVSVSDEIYRILHISRAEYGATFGQCLNFVHPDERSLVEEWLTEAAAVPPGETTSKEFRIVTRDGKIRILHARARIEVDSYGKVIRMRGTIQDVTDARRAEEALKLTQFSMDHASVSAFIVARDARITYVNEQACRGLGYSREELLSMSIPDLDPYFPHSRWSEHWDQLKKERFMHFESIHRRKDGVLIPMDISINYLDFKGHEYNVAFTQDISERKNAENELRHAYDLTKTIIDSVNDAISLIDVRNFRIVSANKVFLRNYGYSEVSDVVGRSCYELTHQRPDVCSAPDDICPLVQTVKSGEHFSVDHVHRDTAGNKIYVEVSTSPIRDESGEIIQVVHVQRNITERKRAEESMRESEERFRAFFELAAVGTAQADPATMKFVRTNRRFSEMTGYSTEELRSMTFIDLTHPDDRVINAEKFSETLHPDAPGLEMEKRYIRKDGRVIWVHVSATVVRDAEKKPLHTAAIVQDITERKAAEEALRISESRFRNLFKQSSISMQLLSPQGEITEVNHAFEELWGLSQEALRNYNMLEDKQLVAKGIMPYIRKGFSGEATEIPILKYDPTEMGYSGHARWVKSFIYPVKTGTGNIHQVVLMHWDVTEMVLAQEALRESEARFRAFFESAAMGAAEVDPDTRRFISVNDRLCEITGYSRKELTSKTAYELTHQDDQEADSREFERAKRGEIREHAIVKRYIHKDGHVVWVNVSGSIIRDREGRPIRAVGIIQDVTERKKAEEALRESEERFRAFFELAAVGAVEVDPATGRYLTVNDRFCRIMGHSREELLSKKIQDLTHPDDRQRDTEFFEAIKRNELNEYESEKKYIRKDGRIVWGHVSVVVIRDSRGRPVRTAAIVQDITARKQAEAALRRSEEFLRRTLDNLIAFVAVLDHKGVLVEVNRSALEIAGLQQQDVLVKPFEETYWFSWSGEAKALVHTAIQKGLAGEISRFDMEIRIAGNARMPVDFMLAPIRDEQGNITHLIPSAIDITNRKRMEDEIKHLAHHDPLTGLPNRRLFRDIMDLEFAQARRNGKKVAVLFVDLDRFKQINDTLGHEAGDNLLKEVAERFQRTIRTSDSVARIGGDEFNLVLSDLGRVEDVSDICRKIIDSLRKAFIIGANSLHVTGSIGISIFPDDSTDREDLLRFADIAMYHAKEIGRNTFQFYNPSINVSSLERMKLENWLHQSIRRNELIVHYQPQVDMRSKKIKFAEALVRWKHPERGLLPPAEFIPLAEETGFITSIDEWVLRTVCSQVRAWRDTGLDFTSVTVNLSARQFQSPELVGMIKTVIGETGMQPGSLDIEITESLAMKDVDKTALQLRELRDMGIHVSVDDFGTGYSSLNYLKKMPIERIKIDKSFIRDIATDPDDRTIINAVTSMAHKMGIRTVAEGVETEEQFSFLLESECDEAQGFLFSKPIPAEEFRELASAGLR